LLESHHYRNRTVPATTKQQDNVATQEQQAAMGPRQASSNITDMQRGAGETGSASSQVQSSA
jgi:methyl-accepting chemotaxis protein